jgi:hypothetical protein
MCPIAFCAAAGLAFFTVQAAAASILSRQLGAQGTLTYDTTATAFTFDYTTSSPNETNYIGIWAANADLSDEGIIPKPALRWELAPLAEGTTYVAPEHLEPGNYTAYLLAVTGDFTHPPLQLSEPLSVLFEGLPANLSFPVEQATLHNARQREKYTAFIGGMVLGKGPRPVKFEKVNGDRWINVSPDGTISGVPRRGCSQMSKATVRATAPNGSTATIDFVIPVRGAAQTLVEDVSIMSYNLWLGGMNMHNYHEKQLRFILGVNVDIIGIQEGGPVMGEHVKVGNHLKRLALALGWNHWSSNYTTGVISRYPIVEEYGQVLSQSGGVRVSLNGNSKDLREINIWDTHTHPIPEGAGEFCVNGSSPAEVLEVEAASGRVQQIELLLERMQDQIANSAERPVVLVGDFNAPSHLDWIPSMADQNCGIESFSWPTSKMPVEAGLIDSFRAAHPDPTKEIGDTWSPINKDSGWQDRIDFVYATKELTVVTSETLVVGDPKPLPNERENEWTSDHRAVLTRFHWS